MDLKDILTTHHALFERLAESWLAAGANTFELWEHDRRIACWPAEAAAATVCVQTPIQTSGSHRRALRISGSLPPAAEGHLAADAALIALMLRLETEQETMVADLIDMQDQLLMVYDLTQSDCYHSYFLEIEQLLGCMAQEIARMLKTEGGFLMLLRTGHPSRHLVCYPAPIQQRVEACLALSSFSAETCENEVLWNSGSSEPVLPEGVCNVLFVPIKVRADICMGMGVLNSKNGFASPDLKLLQAIAEQASTRIENFLLHLDTLAQTRLQTEMQMARQVQQRLLPQQLPQIEGLDIYADWRPSRQASGDFYDFLLRPDYPLLFTVGDVAGKGMPAALMTIEALTEIRSQMRLLLDPGPAEIMRCVNETLYEDFSQVEMIATIFLGQYEPSCRELRYTNAGHAPVIYCPAAGFPHLLKADALPIGVLPTVRYQNQTLHLNEGDILIVATDGFNEAFNATGEMFGYQRLLDLIGSIRTQSAQDIASSLFAAIERFSGHTSEEHMLDDDQAIIVLKATSAAIDACMRRNRIIRLELPTALHYLEVLQTTVASLLSEAAMAEEQAEQTHYQIRLAVHELCANIIQHAYAQQAGHINIILTLASSPHRLIVETYDTGKPFNPGKIPEPDLLHEGGRGLQLICGLMDQVIYHASNDYAWQSKGGCAWLPVSQPHPQPGSNAWRLVKVL
jgi:sigma-B regulation protein RsbU (phosphoserine phosphatase)